MSFQILIKCLQSGEQREYLRDTQIESDEMESMEYKEGECSGGDVIIHVVWMEHVE